MPVSALEDKCSAIGYGSRVSRSSLWQSLWPQIWTVSNGIWWQFHASCIQGSVSQAYHFSLGLHGMWHCYWLCTSRVSDFPPQKAGELLCEGEWRITRGKKSCFHKYVSSSNDLQLWQYVHINYWSCLGIVNFFSRENKIFSSCFSSGLNKTLYPRKSSCYFT